MKSLFPYILILTISCVEHSFLFKVSPNGSYQVQYQSHGDRKDLMDYDFSVPTYQNWEIHSTLDNHEAESYDYTASHFFKKNELFPSTFYTSDSIYNESLLLHPILINHANWYFWEKFTFEGKFLGRKVENKYPLVGELIIDIENPPNGWMKEALAYILKETLRQSDVEWNILPIISSELNNWIELDLNSISDSILYENIDYYKNLGLDIIMHPVSPKIYNKIDSIFKVLEDELKITLDLIDDSFEFHLILPGNLISTNADSLYGDTLFWEFQLEDYMNGDYMFSAVAEINYSQRQKYGIFIILVIIVLFFKIKMKKHKKEWHEFQK